MSQLEHALAEIVTTVWDSVLGLAVVQDDGFQVSGAHPEHTFAGVVQIQGAWDGAVAVQCSDHLARQAAMTMFNMTESEVSISDLQDALGELTNMTGGHIKALMPEAVHPRPPRSRRGCRLPVPSAGQRAHAAIVISRWRRRGGGHGARAGIMTGPHHQQFPPM